MAGEKFVINNPVVEIQKADLSWVDISTYVRNLTIAITRKAVDTSAYGDPADRGAKGPGAHTITFDAIHARAMSAFTAVFATELNREDATPFRVKYKNAAVDTDNRQFLGSMLVTSMPVGAARGEVMGFSATYQVDGQITMTDGVTPVLL